MLLVEITTRGEPNYDNSEAINAQVVGHSGGTTYIAVVRDEESLDALYDDAETYERVKILAPIDSDEALKLIRQLTDAIIKNFPEKAPLVGGSLLIHATATAFADLTSARRGPLAIANNLLGALDQIDPERKTLRQIDPENTIFEG